MLADDFTRLIGDRLDGLTLVKGTLQLPGTFLVQHYLRLLLSQNYKVVFVAAEQSVERYSFACKKLGINLAQAQLTGQLVCVTPPLADMGSPDGLGASNGCVDGTGSGAGAGAGDTTGRGAAAAGSRLQRLCAAVRAAAEQQPQGAGAAAAAAAAAVAGVALLIDSLTLLVSGLCDGRHDRDAFLHHCCSARGAAQLLAAAAGAGAAAAGEAEQAAGRLAAVSEAGGGGTAAQLQQLPCCVVVGVHTDVPDDQPWLRALEHTAAVVVRVEPLPGRVADVDGLITVTQRRVAARHRLPSRAPAVVDTPHAAAGPSLSSFPPAPAPGVQHSLYFRATDLAVRWMRGVTERELLWQHTAGGGA